jgi:hypothetical protein
MNGALFYMINSSATSLLPPLLKWVGLREMTNDDEVLQLGQTEICWGDPHQKKLSANAHGLPLCYISEIKLGSTEAVKIRGAYKTHMCITIYLTESGASLLESLYGSPAQELIFSARKAADLLDLFLTMRLRIRNNIHPDDLSCDPDAADSDPQSSVEQLAALKWMSEQRLADERLQAEVYFPAPTLF